MAKIDFDEETLNILERDEPKFIRALELYYSNFDTDKIMSFKRAAREAEVNPAYLVDYMFYCDAYIGMPETRENAVLYLKNLGKYKKLRMSKL